MTKTDLIEKLYEENYCTKKDAEALVNAVFDAIRDAMVAGDKVTISKFGTFEVYIGKIHKTTPIFVICI